MSKYADISKSLQDSLGLGTSPIAVCIADMIPDGVSRPDRRLAAGCAFWQEAAERPIATSTADHEQCAIGVYTHNMTDVPASYHAELGDVLKVMADLSYVRPEDVARIPVLRRQARYIIYAPLAMTPLDPDAVLLFVHSRQGLVVTEAAQQVDPESPPALGRPACAVVPQAINTGRAALSLGCCGARTYIKAFSDDIALWALPGSRVAEYAERIAAVAKANEVLTRFHIQRQKDVASGLTPTCRESLSRM